MCQLLDVASDSKITTVPIITSHEQPITDDINSILNIVKKKYPSKFDKVQKTLIETD